MSGQESSRTNSSVKETPLPWGKLAVLLAVQITEPLGLTIILPFMYQMVGGFDIVHDPKDISFYAAFLFMSYQLLKTITAMYWGTTSDRIGRRPVILVGLLGDFLTFALFGVSKSFTWAIIVRSLNGFFTGNAVVIKPIVAEIADDTNRGRMMAMLPLMFHVGILLGGAIGGLLANPVTNYPWLFGNSVLFREYPFLLPCLVGSSISLFGMVVGYFCLEETLVVKQTQSASDSSISETTSLISESQREEGQCQANSNPEPLSKWDILTPTVIRIFAVNACLCFAFSMQAQLYPIFAATDIAIGGLGMSTQTIGYTFIICSVFIIFIQLAVFPKNELKYGALRCYRHGLLMLALYCITCPLLSTVAKHTGNSVGDQYGTGIIKFLLQGSYLFWALLVVELYLLMHADAFAWTSMFILVSNAAPKKEYLGFINGLLSLVYGITYIFGPLVSGYLWSWSLKHTLPYPFNSHLAWVASSVPFLIGWYISLGIPESVNVFASGCDEQNSPVSCDERINDQSDVPK